MSPLPPPPMPAVVLLQMAVAPSTAVATDGRSASRAAIAAGPLAAAVGPTAAEGPAGGRTLSSSVANPNGVHGSPGHAVLIPEAASSENDNDGLQGWRPGTAKRPGNGGLSSVRLSSLGSMLTLAHIGLLGVVSGAHRR